MNGHTGEWITSIRCGLNYGFINKNDEFVGYEGGTYCTHNISNNKFHWTCCSNRQFDSVCNIKKVETIEPKKIEINIPKINIENICDEPKKTEEKKYELSPLMENEMSKSIINYKIPRKNEPKKIIHKNHPKKPQQTQQPKKTLKQRFLSIFKK